MPLILIGWRTQEFTGRWMKSILKFQLQMLSLYTLTNSSEQRKDSELYHLQIDARYFSSSTRHELWWCTSWTCRNWKTETVKDLGRTLGIFVVVTNWSGEHKYRDMAKIFKGLCQSGLWGWFDEFNRIALASLYVVAAQVEAITIAKKTDAKIFTFPNDLIPAMLMKSCTDFITMNPGYAGRQEFPENLKVLFRGVTMMQPDRQIIIKVKLASVGYNEVWKFQRCLQYFTDFMKNNFQIKTLWF